VTTDDDGLGPAGNKAGNAGNDNGLTENSSATARSVSYAPIWRRRFGAYRMLRMVPLGESHTNDTWLASGRRAQALSTYSSSA
jgi:hypothetical protein